MSSRFKFIFLTLVTCLYASSAFGATGTLVICSKNSDGKITLRTRCKRGETKISNRSSLVGATGATGATGVTGATGADGVLGVYGDGSSGAFDASSGVLGTGNLQYTTCNISSSQLLIVPSGTILRCTGSADIQGSILVSNQANGGYVGSFAGTNVYTSRGHSANSGISRAAASNGEMGSTAATVLGGSSSFGMGDDETRLSYRPSLFGCGGGGGSAGLGGSGGGYFAILAKGAITVSGTISAVGSDGTSGSGGGAGGIVVLASKTSVTLSSGSTISVDGGDGSASAVANAAGGGGAAGIVHFIAPSISTSAGTISFDGGSAGSQAVAINQNVAVGGGAGGHCVFSGGAGGSIPAGRPATSFGVGSGSTGTSIQLLADPTTLFLN